MFFGALSLGRIGIIMQIPTEQDWMNYITLDEIVAKKNFFGKTLEEAEAMFVENALVYEEDILWMHSVPFRYYVHAYINYLLGNQSKFDTEAVSCFLSMIEFKAKYDQDDLLAVWTRVQETLEHIRKNHDWFNWNESIFGNLEEKTTRLLSWIK